jgi:hypothetical protein
MSYTHEQIEQAIAEWQKRLRLRDWVFGVDWAHEPESETAWAEVKRIPGRKCAVIRFAKNHLAFATSAEMNLTIAHELCHIVLEPLENVIDLALCGASAEKGVLVQRLAHDGSEIVTDAIAVAFCEAYPAPESLAFKPVNQSLGTTE